MNKIFSVIACDPPWSFQDFISMSAVKRGADAHYKTMSIEELKHLPIKDISDPEGCVLALWCPSSFLKDGLEIMESWSFCLKQTYVWTKTKKTIAADLKLDQTLAFGMGRLFRNCHEITLIGINTTKIYQKLQNKSQRSVSFAPNFGHSIKPETLQNSLDLMFPNANKIELFARRAREKWTCIGNECQSTLGEDIRTSLDKIIKSQ